MADDSDSDSSSYTDRSIFDDTDGDDTDACINDIDIEEVNQDELTPIEEIDQDELIPFFSDHEPDEGIIHLSAYGTYYYALVIDGHRLVIYNPDTRSSMASYDLEDASECWSTPCTFTSVIVDRDDNKDDFFLSISNGSMLSCIETPRGYMFAPSTDSTIPGFVVTEHVAALKPKTLLGANRNWLAYQSTGKSLVFLRNDECVKEKTMSLMAFKEIFEEDIVAHAFCSATDVLWVATVVESRYWLYKVDPNKRATVKFEIDIPDDIGFEIDIPTYFHHSYDLLAVSTQGDVAVHCHGVFVIYQPERDTWLPHPILIGNSLKNNDGGQGCFAAYRGHEYFIFCGTKYVEIAIAMKIGRNWEYVHGFRRGELENWTDFYLNDWGETILSHLGLDGQGRLVVRVLSESLVEEQDEGLLVSLPFST